jgi:hypothetical protein
LAASALSDSRKTFKVAVNLRPKSVREFLPFDFDVRFDRRFDEPPRRPAWDLADIRIPRPGQQTSEGRISRFAAAAAIIDEAINCDFVDGCRCDGIR